MVYGLEYSILSLTILLLIITITQGEKPLKTSIFLSPKFTINPGSVFQNTFHNIDFPKGHIAIKTFDLEIVDKGGNPLSIYNTYLHHYHVIRYYARKLPKTTSRDDDILVIKNKGLCDNDLVQYFGLGSESRNTKKYIPDPYGIVVGDHTKIPDGYEERWMVDVHVIDTRGVEDRMGCIECRCDVYNVTKDMDGQDLRLGYKGGLRCCYNNTKCRLQEGFLDSMATMFLKYTIKYVDWDKDVMPVDVYVLDVSTTLKSSNGGSGGLVTYHCQTEYDVKPCSASTDKSECIDSKKTNLSLPNDGDIIYAVAHQHTGGIGSSLYKQDGQVLCSSKPIYGTGTEPGNEAGYVVGMSTCYPKPGTAKISAGESLTIVSNYSNAQMHTGVTGIFYVIVAESLPKFDAVTYNVTKKQRISYVWLMIMVSGVLAIMAIIIMGYQKRCKKDGYKPLRI